MSSRRFCRPPRLHLPPAGRDVSKRVSPTQPSPASAGEEGEDAGARTPRHLALALPSLPIARLRRAGLEGPLILWRASGPQREVAASSLDSIPPGQPLGDAQAVCPNARFLEDSPDSDRAFLAAIALWATRFTPLVATDGEDGLILDISGCAHLFGGEAALLARVTEGLARQGIPARGAIAGAPACAAALARAGEGRIVPPGEEAAAVAGLPLAALRIAAETRAALGGLGLWQVGQVRRQPRAPLARRFGQALLLALDEAAGEVTRPISPIRPPPELEASRGFLEPLITREAIDIAAEALLRDLCLKLVKAGRAARRFALLAWRVDGTVQEIGFGTGLATRDAAHLGRLLAHRLEKLEPGFGFERMALAAEDTEAFSGAQSGLSREAGEEALAQLLDRLAQRVALWRLAPRASHWPEREVARVSAFARIAAPEGWPARPRPVRLLRQPMPVGAVALLPDAPPSLLRIGRHGHRVLRAEGPERLAAEWWREERPDRDYYRLELEGGARLWVVRIGFGAEARWFVHGRFA